MKLYQWITFLLCGLIGAVQCSITLDSSKHPQIKSRSLSEKGQPLKDPEDRIELSDALTARETAALVVVSIGLVYIYAFFLVISLSLTLLSTRREAS